jgi:hypothetical protein
MTLDEARGHMGGEVVKVPDQQPDLWEYGTYGRIVGIEGQQVMVQFWDAKRPSLVNPGDLRIVWQGGP